MTKFKVLTDRLNTFFTNNKITTGNSIPTSGEWNVGDICISSIQENGECGWICTESGTPGKWEIFGSGGSGKLVSLTASVEVTGPVTEVSLDGLGTNVSENDKLFVHYNSTHLLEGVDFEIISNGTKIRKLGGGSWNESSSNAMFAFELLKHVKKVNGDNVLLDSKMCVLKSNKTILAPASEVEIGIEGFNKDTDYLTVYVNSTYLTEGVDYNISSDSRKIVSLNGNWNEESLSDYRFSFVVIKEVGIVNPEAVVGTENLKDSSVTMSKLGEDVIERLDENNLQIENIENELSMISVKNFGAIGDGITDDTTSIKNAIEYAKNNKKVLFFNNGIYLVTESLNTSNVYIMGEMMKETVIKFNLNNNIDNCICIGGTQTGIHSIQNLTIDANVTGLDVICMTGGDRPRICDVTIKNSYRDSLVLDATAEWAWIENLYVHRVLITNAGRHGYRFSVGGNSGNFINENLFDHCEIRGIGRRFKNSNFIFAESTASIGQGTGNKISMMTFNACNFDASANNAVEGGVIDGIRCCGSVEYDSNYESWRFINGGYESLNKACTGYVFNAEENSRCSNWVIEGVVRYNFNKWYSPTLLSRNDITLNNLSGSIKRIPTLDELNVKNKLNLKGENLFLYEKDIINTKVSLVANETQEIIIPIPSILGSGNRKYCYHFDINIFNSHYQDLNIYTDSDYKLLSYKVEWSSNIINNLKEINVSGKDSRMSINSIVFDYITNSLKVNITTTSMFGANSGNKEVHFHIVYKGNSF